MLNFFNDRITKDYLDYLTERYPYTASFTNFAKLYGIAEEEFLEKLENGEIRYIGFCSRLVMDLAVIIFFDVYTAFFKGDENKC